MIYTMRHMKYIFIILIASIFGCSSNDNINNTSWIAKHADMSVVMFFNNSNVTISIKEGDKIVHEIKGVYSIVDDTIRIGEANNFDKAIVKNNELLFIEKNGITKFKKQK